MSIIPNYPPPDADLTDTDLLLGWQGGKTRRVPISSIVAVGIENAMGDSPSIAPSQAAVAAALNLIVNGQVAFNLPDEAKGQAIPTAGSGLPYLSAGVLKIA